MGDNLQPFGSKAVDSDSGASEMIDEGKFEVLGASNKQVEVRVMLWAFRLDTIESHMTIRLFLILTFLAQQVALPVVFAVSRPSEGCLATSCCRVVEITTCCGEVVQEMTCGKTGGECRCSIENNDSAPAPQAPAPRDVHESAPAMLELNRALHCATVVTSLQPRGVAPTSIRTHNETQALLCIWRT